MCRVAVSKRALSVAAPVQVPRCPLLGVVRAVGGLGSAPGRGKGSVVRRSMCDISCGVASAALAVASALVGRRCVEWRCRSAR